MTDEKLEKEAEEYAKEVLKEFKFKFEVVKQAFIDSARNTRKARALCY
jgi:thermostable 8-oxoguanine DNA glycosylase